MRHRHHTIEPTYRLHFVTPSVRGLVNPTVGVAARPVRRLPQYRVDLHAQWRLDVAIDARPGICSGALHQPHNQRPWIGALLRAHDCAFAPPAALKSAKKLSALVERVS